MRRISGLALALLFVAGCAAPAASPTTAPPTAPAGSPVALATSALARPTGAVTPAATSVVATAGSPSAGGSAVATAIVTPQALLFTGTQTPGFTLQSTAFPPNGTLPAQYSCQAPAPQTPPLSWTGAPVSTKSFLVVLQDNGAPGVHFPNGPISHWLVYNIPATTTQLAAGIPTAATLPDGSKQAQNVRHVNGYQGPCAPASGPPHAYTFQVYALDQMLTMPDTATFIDFGSAMKGHILAQAELISMFHLSGTPTATP